MKLPLDKNRLAKAGFFSLSGLATVFILANAFAISFNYYLPFIYAVGPVDLEPLSRYADQQSESVDAPYRDTHLGNFGEPQLLRIPSMNHRLPLVQAIYSSANNSWLSRAHSGHFMVVTESKNGYIGDTIVYMRRNYRTIPSPSELTIESNIVIDTDKGWRYVFRINEIATDQRHDFIIRGQENPTLILYIFDQDSQRYIIASATLINLQAQ